MLTIPLIVSSPDGSLVLTFTLKRGSMYYSVSYHGRSLVGDSRLGVAVANTPALADDMSVIDMQTRSVDETWQQHWGQQEFVRNNYNELAVQLREFHPPERDITVRFRVFNDGVSFRYELPYQPNLKSYAVADELTEFAIATDAVAWWIPAYQADRYEYSYTKSNVGDLGTVHTPLTIKTRHNDHIAIHEAALYNYGSMTVHNDDGTLKADITPLATGLKSRLLTPSVFPWRVIQVAPSAPALLHSTIMLNLNDPPASDRDFSWVKPLKFMGIWWGMFVGEYTWATGERHGATTKNAKRYIDYCHEYGIQGLLIEGWNYGWDGDWMQNGDKFNFTHPTDDFDIEAVCRYAREKGVEIIGHHETSGDVLNYESQLPEAFEYYQRLGIRYVKLGYVGSRMNHKEFHHSQYGVRHYQKVVELAAKYGIMVDIHEPIKGTGIERTWPNLLTREGGRGQEYEGGALLPDHAAHIPYTRGLSGGFDYTPGIFDVTNYSKRVASTLARQLALYVVIYSSMQMVADRPQVYKDRPEFKFIQDVPVDWSELRPLAGEVGEYVVIARKDRHSDDWYIGGLTDENARAVALQLDFVAPGSTFEAELYCDAPTAHWRDNQLATKLSTRTVKYGDALKVQMAPGGGFAIRLRAMKAQ